MKLTVDEWIEGLLDRYRDEGEAKYACVVGHISAILKVAVIMGHGLTLHDVDGDGIELINSHDDEDEEIGIDSPVPFRLVTVADGPDERVEVD